MNVQWGKCSKHTEKYITVDLYVNNKFISPKYSWPFLYLLCMCGYSEMQFNLDEVFQVVNLLFCVTNYLQGFNAETCPREIW